MFSRLNDIYDFDLDVAATEQNKMCDLYFTKENDALGLSWEGRCWCNPPYSCAGEFVKKAIDEYKNPVHPTAAELELKDAEQEVTA